MRLSKKRGLVCALVLVFVLSLALPTFAYPAYELKPSVRGTGMGNAFTGVAQGDGSIFFNPAAIANLDSGDVRVVFGSQFGFYKYMGILYSKPGLGFGVLSTKAELVTRGQYGEPIGVENVKEALGILSFGRSYGTEDELLMGGNVKCYTEDVLGVRRNGIALDLGVLLRLGEVSLGLSGMNLAGIVKEQGGVSEDLIPSFRFGVALEPTDDILLAFDIADKNVHYGGEYRRGCFVFQVGGMTTNIGNRYTYGVGMSLKNLEIRYSSSTHPTLDSTHIISGQFNF